MGGKFWASIWLRSERRCFPRMTDGSGSVDVIQRGKDLLSWSPKPHAFPGSCSKCPFERLLFQTHEESCPFEQRSVSSRFLSILMAALELCTEPVINDRLRESVVSNQWCFPDRPLLSRGESSAKCYQDLLSRQLLLRPQVSKVEKHKLSALRVATVQTATESAGLIFCCLRPWFCNNKVKPQEKRKASRQAALRTGRG